MTQTKTKKERVLISPTGLVPIDRLINKYATEKISLAAFMDELRNVPNLYLGYIEELESFKDKTVKQIEALSARLKLYENQLQNITEEEIAANRFADSLLLIADKIKGDLTESNPPPKRKYKVYLPFGRDLLPQKLDLVLSKWDIPDKYKDLVTEIAYQGYDIRPDDDNRSEDEIILFVRDFAVGMINKVSVFQDIKGAVIKGNLNKLAKECIEFLEKGRNTKEERYKFIPFDTRWTDKPVDKSMEKIEVGDKIKEKILSLFPENKREEIKISDLARVVFRQSKKYKNLPIYYKGVLSYLLSNTIPSMLETGMLKNKKAKKTKTDLSIWREKLIDVTAYMIYDATEGEDVYKLKGNLLQNFVLDKRYYTLMSHFKNYKQSAQRFILEVKGSGYKNQIGDACKFIAAPIVVDVMVFSPSTWFVGSKQTNPKINNLGVFCYIYLVKTGLKDYSKTNQKL